MNETDRVILFQLHEFCQKIEDRIAEFEIDEASFVSNSAFFDMLLMPIFQIGELAAALSDEYRECHREIPWHALKGFRNIIGHDYGVVDPQWAWNTIQSDIPVLKAFLESELEQF